MVFRQIFTMRIRSARHSRNWKQNSNLRLFGCSFRPKHLVRGSIYLLEGSLYPMFCMGWGKRWRFMKYSKKKGVLVDWDSILKGIVIFSCRNKMPNITNNELSRAKKLRVNYSMNWH